jgi:hypothetical protein
MRERIKACERCGSSFVKPAKLDWARWVSRRFCSRQCSAAWRGEETFDARLIGRIDFTGSCWQWMGTLDTGGYGQISSGGQLCLVHRLVYEWVRGPVDLELDHLCRNRTCVNPAHLEPVTHAEYFQHVHPAKRGTHMPDLSSGLP